MSTIQRRYRPYLSRLKFEFRSLVAREPWLSALHRPVIWWTQYKMNGHIDTSECLVTPETEFVLDGFQGSGNSFATVAFKYAQTEPVHLAHHLHSPAQIIKAVELRIPILVTLREPANAVVSLVSRWTDVSLRQGLRSYIGFYEKIEPFVDHMVISPFEQTTQHLDRVFKTVNDRFETRFDVFRPTEANVRAVRGARPYASDGEQERQTRKQEYLETIQTQDYRPFLNRAQAVHDRLKRQGVGS